MTGSRHDAAAASPLAAALALGLALPALARCGSVGGAAIVAAALGAALWRPRLSLAGALLCLAAGACGGLWAERGIDALARDPLAPLVGRGVRGPAAVTGIVRPTFGGYAATATFRGTRVDLRARTPFSTGDILAVRGTLERPRPPGEDGFDEREWLGRQGIHVVLEAHEAELVGRRAGVQGAIDALRRDALRVLGGYGEASGVSTGIVLGVERALSPATIDDFRTSGTAHLLAVSGANVAALAVLVLGAAWLAGAPRAVAHALAIAVIAGYALLVGPSPSVVRASVAGGLMSLAWLANRPADRWHALAVGAAAVQALDPWAVASPGFQLSFAAVAAIFALAPRLRAWLEGVPCPDLLREPLALAVACTLATAPFALWHFDRAALAGSVPANLLAVPASAPLLWLGLAAALLAPLSDAAAAYPAGAAASIGVYLIGVARLGAWLDGHGLALAWLAGLAAALVFGNRVPRRRRAAAWLAAAALAAACVPLGTLAGARQRPPPPGLRVTFLDVGQGSAALVEAPHLAVLVDAGPEEAGVAAKLRRLGVARLDALVLTHPQADHVGGGAGVLRALAVGRVVHPGIAAASPDMSAALAAAAERGVPVQIARAGQLLAAGPARIEVLGPRRLHGGDPNDDAVVLDVRQGACAFLLTADAEAAATLPLGLRPAGVLGVAHHGSGDPELPRLLARVRPRLAVISVGAANRYGHPSADTLAALRAGGAAVERTDERGDVAVACPRADP